MAGVPQGSVLGPLLFLVYINDLFGLVTNELDVFADDSSLWSIIKNITQRKQVADSMNADLIVIAEWAKKWLVTHNHTKTELVTISKKRDVSAFHGNGLHKDGYFLPGPVACPHPPLLFHDKQIPERPQVKVVGLTMCHNLSWGTHISNVYRNANRSLALLRRARAVLHAKALATIYKAFIRSQLEYCCPIWMGGSMGALNRLDRIQVRAVRIIGHTEGIKLDSLAHRRGVAALCVMHRLVKKRAPSPLHSLIPMEAKTRRSAAHLRIQPAFVPPNVRKAKYWQRSCVPLLTSMWNTLVKPEIRALPNQQLFKERVHSTLDLTFVRDFA